MNNCAESAKTEGSQNEDRGLNIVKRKEEYDYLGARAKIYRQLDQRTLEYPLNASNAVRQQQQHPELNSCQSEEIAYSNLEEIRKAVEQLVSEITFETGIGPGSTEIGSGRD